MGLGLLELRTSVDCIALDDGREGPAEVGLAERDPLSGGRAGPLELEREVGREGSVELGREGPCEVGREGPRELGREGPRELGREEAEVERCESWDAEEEAEETRVGREAGVERAEREPEGGEGLVLDLISSSMLYLLLRRAAAMGGPLEVLP
mmetsp:Transcript_13525/g.18555  ORF Transcript_13525/g.18555 Transcript_13525/m.18555 type:complete len:153 (+) Transcript_13525:168-626(+)